MRGFTASRRVLVPPGELPYSCISLYCLLSGGRLGALRRSLKDSAELVFVDPPHVVEMPTDPSDFKNKFDSDASAAPTSEADTPRAWWFAESQDGKYRKFTKFDETLHYLRGILEKSGPFDGVFGFSQGAACAAMLAALCENPSLDPIFAEPSSDSNVQWPPKPFQFAILSAGFFPLDPRTSAYFDTKPKTPTLHILGKVRPAELHTIDKCGGLTADSPLRRATPSLAKVRFRASPDLVRLFPCTHSACWTERSVPLTEAFDGARVEWHEGGHHTPSKASWRKFIQVRPALVAGLSALSWSLLIIRAFRRTSKLSETAVEALRRQTRSRRRQDRVRIHR